MCSGQPNLNVTVDREQPRVTRSTSPMCRMRFRLRLEETRSLRS